ncbi:MAG: hypothetical protein KJ630_10215 [Proteobacteria bacterium]|nr:hypothetical protein [Pseudomonadota bacterium]
MIESIYSFLAAVGFTHPLHPMLTHVPMGMIIGMVVFSLLGLILKNTDLGETAFHCSVLALLAVGPVIAAGVLDWLHLQQGEWNKFIIIKMILGTVLTILLGVSVTLKKKGASPAMMFLFYFLCLACAGGLGYSGGTLVYG